MEVESLYTWACPIDDMNGNVSKDSILRLKINLIW